MKSLCDEIPCGIEGPADGNYNRHLMSNWGQSPLESPVSNRPRALAHYAMCSVKTVGDGVRPTVPKICYRLGAPTNFDRSAVLIVRFICHRQCSQTNPSTSQLFTPLFERSEQTETHSQNGFHRAVISSSIKIYFDYIALIKAQYIAFCTAKYIATLLYRKSTAENSPQCFYNVISLWLPFCSCSKLNTVFCR